MPSGVRSDADPARDDPVHQEAMAEELHVGPQQRSPSGGGTGTAGMAKATSLQIAPRSPRWLAIRSRSRNSARSQWARSGTTAAGERLRPPGIGERVGDRGVAGDPARQPGRLLPGQGFEPFLDPLVHVAELLLEVEDVLAHGLETEMARLDDAGMHRSDRDLVDPLSFGPDPAVLARERGAAAVDASKDFRSGQASAGQSSCLIQGRGSGWPVGRHPHEALHLPFEPEGGRELLGQAREGRIVSGHVAS